MEGMEFEAALRAHRQLLAALVRATRSENHVATMLTATVAFDKEQAGDDILPLMRASAYRNEVLAIAKAVDALQQPKTSWLARLFQR